MTQFLVDAGCDAIVVRTLRKPGYDVTFVAEVSPGKSDADILAWGLREQRVIVTEDQDFCELVFKNKLPTYRIVPMRRSDQNRMMKPVQITHLVNQRSRWPRFGM